MDDSIVAVYRKGRQNKERPLFVGPRREARQFIKEQ